MTNTLNLTNENVELVETLETPRENRKNIVVVDRFTEHVKQPWFDYVCGEFVD